jgi:hypothetical protein
VCEGESLVAVQDDWRGRGVLNTVGGEGS